MKFAYNEIFRQTRTTNREILSRSSHLMPYDGSRSYNSTTSGNKKTTIKSGCVNVTSVIIVK